MIRQHKKIDTVDIHRNTITNSYRLTFMEPITGYGCNTFWNGQSAERIQLQSLCSVWTSGNAVVLSSPVYGFHQYGSQSKRYQQKKYSWLSYGSVR